MIYGVLINRIYFLALQTPNGLLNDLKEKKILATSQLIIKMFLFLYVLV